MYSCCWLVCIHVQIEIYWQNMGTIHCTNFFELSGDETGYQKNAAWFSCLELTLHHMYNLITPLSSQFRLVSKF